MKSHCKCLYREGENAIYCEFPREKTKISQQNFLFHSQYPIEMCDKAIKIKSRKCLATSFLHAPEWGNIVKTSNCDVCVKRVCNTIAYRRFFLFLCTFLVYMFRVQGYIYCMNTCDIDFFIGGYAHMVLSPHRYITRWQFWSETPYTQSQYSLVKSWSLAFYQFPWKQQFHSVYLHAKASAEREEARQKQQQE